MGYSKLEKFAREEDGREKVIRILIFRDSFYSFLLKKKRKKKGKINILSVAMFFCAHGEGWKR